MIQPVFDDTTKQSEAGSDTADVVTQFEGDDFDMEIMTGKGIQLKDDCDTAHLVGVVTVALFNGGCDLV